MGENASLALPIDAMPFDTIADATERSEWLRARQGGIGASEIAIVLGASTFRTPIELYAQKVGAMEPDEDPPEYIAWGNLLEPAIAAEFARRTGREIRLAGKLLRSRVHPWALATLDYWQRERAPGSPWCPLQIKTTSGAHADDWADGAPKAYWWQEQQEMLVTASPRASIACLIGGQRMVWQDIDRDDAALVHLVREGEAFWQRVIDRDEPMADGSAGAGRALFALHPQDDGTEVVLPATLLEVDDELQALAAQQTAIETRIDELKNRIRTAIGDAQRGFLGGESGVSWSWKTEERAAYQVKAGTRRVLRRHERKESR